MNFKMSASIRVAKFIKIMKQVKLAEVFIVGSVFKLPTVAVIREKLMVLNQVQEIMPKLTDSLVKSYLTDHKSVLRSFFEKNLKTVLKFEHELAWKKPTYAILKVVRDNERFWEVVEEGRSKKELYEAIRQMPELGPYPELTAKKVETAIYTHVKHLKPEIIDAKWEKKIEGKNYFVLNKNVKK